MNSQIAHTLPSGRSYGRLHTKHCLSKSSTDVLVSYKYFYFCQYEIKLINCITVGCVRGDCAARCHSCASGRCARASHAGPSCSCATGLYLPYAIEAKHRLARVRRLTPLRRRRRPIWPRLEGGPAYRPPTASSIFCPFQNNGRKRGFGLAFIIPSSKRNRPLVLYRPRPGGALEKSGRVGPT